MKHLYLVHTLDNEMFGVPLQVLKKCVTLQDAMELSDSMSVNEIRLPLDLETVQWIVNWCMKPETVESPDEIPWTFFVKLLKAASYLDFTELVEFIGTEFILRAIQQCPCETRLAFPFTREKYQYNDDDWDYVPVIDMNESNYLLHHVPIATVVTISKQLPAYEARIFLRTFGENTGYYKALHREYIRRM